MTTIDATQWKSFADRFSKEHERWTASLRVRQSDGGEEIPIDGRPFRGLTFRNADGPEALIVAFGDDPDEPLVYIIDRPAELSLLGNERDECSLVIGLEDGSGCLLELANPFNPD